MNLPNIFQVEAADGTVLAGREWRPDGQAQHHVLLVHGLGEHLARYDHLGESLAQQGVRTLGVDLRGHGMSKGRRGHVRRWSDYVSDMEAAAEMLPPTFTLLAHSMGGLIALDYLRIHADRVTKTVLSGPLVGEAVDNPAWKKSIAGFLSVVLPWLPIDNGIPMVDLCTDAEEVKRFQNDSMRVKTVTPRWYTEMLAAIDRVWEALPHYTTPLHLHVAGEEKIIDRDALERFYQAWPAQKQRWIWEGGYHEILHEPFREGVVAAMLEGIRD
ncbi:MAG: alpha/beta hydrolase [Planctomycetota bacterium]